MRNLFIDDERFPNDAEREFSIVRNVREAVDYCQQHGCPDYISFDHDLGSASDPALTVDGYENTGMGFAKWLVDAILDNQLSLPNGFSFYVHSMNPIGAENIRKLLGNFLKIYS